jgi:hypothetical protein
VRPRIYCAGPFTGDVDANCARAIDVGEQVERAGFHPVIPHLYRAWDARHPHGYEHWMRLCFEDVESCAGLLRMPGESPGADREVAHAQHCCIPVFDSIEALVLATDWRTR